MEFVAFNADSVEYMPLIMQEKVRKLASYLSTKACFDTVLLVHIDASTQFFFYLCILIFNSHNLIVCKTSVKLCGGENDRRIFQFILNKLYADKRWVSPGSIHAKCDVSKIFHIRIVYWRH